MEKFELGLFAVVIILLSYVAYKATNLETTPQPRRLISYYPASKTEENDSIF